MLSGAEIPEPHKLGQGFEILVASDPEREEVYAELWHDNEMWGEITQEGGKVLLHLYPRQDGEPWSFPPEVAEQQIRDARHALLGEEERPVVADKEAS